MNIQEYTGIYRNIQEYTDRLEKLDISKMFGEDFFWTWDKTDDELEAVFTVADALRHLRENNISTKVSAAWKI